MASLNEVKNMLTGLNTIPFVLSLVGLLHIAPIVPSRTPATLLKCAPLDSQGLWWWQFNPIEKGAGR